MEPPLPVGDAVVLTEQEVRVAAAQAVDSAGSRAAVAEPVAGLALPLGVLIGAQRAPGLEHAVPVGVPLHALLTGQTGGSGGPRAGQTRPVAIWGEGQTHVGIRTATFSYEGHPYAVLAEVVWSIPPCSVTQLAWSISPKSVAELVLSVPPCSVGIVHTGPQ